MNMKRRVLAGAPVFLLALFFATFAAGQPASPPQPGVGPPPVVVPAEQHDISPALRDIPAIESAGPPVFREIPRQPLPKRGPKGGVPDPVLQDSPGSRTTPSPAVSFGGVGNVNNVLPPDTNGDVGPNHYVQWVNLSFAIFNKTTGERIYGPASGNTLWTGFGGPCETRNDGDPIVLYDRLASRWFMSQLALPGGLSGPFYQCIAVSTTSDPTGTYARYAFKVSDTKLNDYPKFGVWPDGYYMAVNQYTCFLFCSWAGQGVVAFERDKMLASDPTAAMVYFDLFGVNPNLGGMLPADLNGPPPAGTPNYFVQVDDDAWGYSPDQLQIWAFSVNWTTPSASTFTFQTALPTAAFDSNMCGYSRNCIPQRGTKRKLDAISDRLMYRLQYRHFPDHASLVVNHTVDVDGTDHGGVRWYELRNGGTGWDIHQQGTYAPDADHRWMGSMAMDGAGNIALGFSVSGPSTYPSIRYTGRLAGDPLNLMTQGEAEIIAGSGSQTHSSGRWGDYSSMSVDPTDDCTFWYTQEYYASTSSAGWQTRIASFRFPSCGAAATPTADLSITKTDSPDPVNVGASLTYTLTATNNGPDTATGVIITDNLPAGVAFVSASSTLGTCNSGPTTVTCTPGSLTMGGVATVQIVVTAPATAGAITNNASVLANEADPNPANNSAQAVTTVVAPTQGTAPVVTACTPSNGNRGDQLIVAVTGSNFQNGATASFGDRVMVQSVTSMNSGQLNVQIKVHPRAASGPRDVTITNPDGQGGTGTGCFSVN